MYFPSNTSTDTIAAAAPVISRVVSDAQELLYLEELKTELGIDLEITDFNEVLLRKIKSALAAVEQYTQVALQPCTVSVNYARYDSAPLPFGPVWESPDVTLTPDYPGATVTITDTTGSQIYGGLFPYVTGSFSAGSVVYKSGYSRRIATTDDQGNIITPADPYPTPDGLIGAVIEHAAASFRSGSLSGGNPGTYWKTLAGSFRRF